LASRVLHKELFHSINLYMADGGNNVPSDANECERISLPFREFHSASFSKLAGNIYSDTRSRHIRRVRSHRRSSSRSSISPVNNFSNKPPSSISIRFRPVDSRITRIGERANRGKTAANATSVRALGAGVMNNNPLLLPGRAINTQLASAHPSRAAIRFVTHSHDICFRAWSARAITNATFLPTDIGFIVARCVS